MHRNDTPPRDLTHVAPVELYLLALGLPCDDCRVGVGLCGRCITSARLVEYWTIAQRRDQTVDELRVAA